MIDIGVNLLDRSFERDLDSVLARAWSAGITRLILTGTNLDNSAAAIAMCRTDPARLASTAGIHPHHAATAPQGWQTTLAHLLQQPGVCAVGETGLDFFRNLSPPATQRQVFQSHLAIAAKHGLPVFVHDRDSRGETAAVIADFRSQLSDVVVHCFTGSADELDRLLELDCHIGITGWVCDVRRGQRLAALVPRIPAHRLMIETDSPYLIPHDVPDHRKVRRNEPANLTYVAKRIAELRAESIDHVRAYTELNARRFFRLG